MVVWHFAISLFQNLHGSTEYIQRDRTVVVRLTNPKQYLLFQISVDPS